MARIRTIKPSFFRHRELYLLEQSSGYPVRLAFAGLWTVADREGRFKWQPDELKLDCLPYDAVDFGALLDVLKGAGYVQQYTSGEKVYGCIPSWSDHQVIGNREAQSLIPAATDTVITKHAQGEGKGREEEKEGKGTDGSSAALTRTEPADATPILLTFPTVGLHGMEWRLRRVQVEEWQAAFPLLDVLAECRKALAWLNANPGRKKTVRGMPKFLVSWLSRATDSGRVSHASELGAVSKLTSALSKASNW